MGVFNLIIKILFNVHLLPYICKFGGAIGGIVSGVVGSVAGSAVSSIFGGGGSSGGGGGGGAALPETSAELKDLQSRLANLGIGITDLIPKERFEQMMADIPLEETQLPTDFTAKYVDTGIGRATTPIDLETLKLDPSIYETQIGEDILGRLGYGRDIDIARTETEQAGLGSIQEQIDAGAGRAAGYDPAEASALQQLQSIISGTGMTPEELTAETQYREQLSGARQDEFSEMLAKIQYAGQQKGLTTGGTQELSERLAEDYSKVIGQEESAFNLQRLKELEGRKQQAMASLVGYGGLESQKQQLYQQLPTSALAAGQLGETAYTNLMAGGLDITKLAAAREEANIARRAEELNMRRNLELQSGALIADIESGNIGRKLTELEARQNRPIGAMSIPMNVAAQQGQQYAASLSPYASLAAAQMQQPTGGAMAGYMGGAVTQGLGNLFSGGGGGGASTTPYAALPSLSYQAPSSAGMYQNWAGGAF